MPREVNATKFAQLIGVAPSTVASAVRRGRIRYRKDDSGGVWIEPESAYRDWVGNMSSQGMQGRPSKVVDPDEFQRRIGEIGIQAAPDGSPAEDSGDDEPENDDDKSLAYWQKLKMRHQARKAEVEADLAERSVVPKAEIQDEWVRTAKIVLTKLMSLPGKCKARMPHLSMEDVQTIDDFVRECCEDLASETGPAATDFGGDDD